MRLIDIDEHFRKNEPFYNADIEMPLHRVKIALEYAPTVEAIPIEWIKAFAEKIWWEDERAVIEDMVERWEKENAKND